MFDRLHNSETGPSTGAGESWQAQELAWKLQRKAQRAAWRAQRRKMRAARLGHFAGIWALFWILFWIAFGLLLAFSPVFRAEIIGFVAQLPGLIVHALHVLLGRPEV